MAKNNKYTAINFNHIYEKTITTSTSTANPPKNPSPSSFHSSTSYSAISAPCKTHGRILVLTRPTPKPVSIPARRPPPPSHPHLQEPPSSIQTAQSESGSDAISLRPLGRTGTGSSLSSTVFSHDKDKGLLPSPSTATPNPEKFVPPHLRPGFVPREEKPGPEVIRSRDAAHRQHRQGYAGSSGRYGEDGRPKSGGYESRRMRRDFGSDIGMMGRPRSSGSRPGSSG